MIITCGQCLAKFKVALEQIKETGSKVRCSNCQHVFTVYRPGFEPDDRDVARSLYGSDGVSSSKKPKSGEADDLYGRNANDDLFSEDDDYGDEEAYDDNQYGESDEDIYSADYPAQERYAAKRDGSDSLSLKERRDRRRRLYADMEEDGDQEYETEEDIDYESEDLLGEDGRPPLRRASARTAQQERQLVEAYEDQTYDDGEYEDVEGYEEEYEEEEYEEEDAEEYGEYDDSAEYDDEDDEYEIPARGERRASLGLAADPVENVAGFIDDADYRQPGQGRGGDGASVRAAVTKVSSRPPLPLIIILAVVVIVLIVGAVFFVTGRSTPTALSSGDVSGSTGESGDGLGLIEPDKADNDGAKHITFTRGSQNHYLRQNNEAGQILIITGMVRNSYPEPRSFIRLRGHILAGDGTSLADRFVYAGNVISEEELKSLPTREILTRLSNKGGQDERNMNIPSGAEIPFMIVFDKLPDGMHEYRIDPVGSSPAQ